MSGPYRFQADDTRSPLDRTSPHVFPTGQAPNFKTNVNRMKTKKWVQAKKNAYDGDDWGDYDEFDEYGVETPPPEPSGYQQARGYDAPARSFTDPQRQGGQQPGRRNSFEAGEEHRAFSASMKPPAQSGSYGHDSEYSQTPQAHPSHSAAAVPLRQASAAESDTSDTPQHRRDFSPSAMPPPLHTRFSPAPGSTTGSPRSQFAPRKSSIGQSDPPAMSPRDRASSTSSKPLPFVRPADIYKRVEEERQRERASLDSSRPSLDSLSSRPREDVPSSPLERTGAEGAGIDTGRTLQPLETVAERRSEYISDGQAGLPTSEDSTKASTPAAGTSASNNGNWSSSPLINASQSVSQPEDPGFRSVVDQAFTRSDDQRSVPPTPISRDSTSVSRSDTNSTSGISPIMSRVPSSATSALKTRQNAGIDNSTPVITEETNEQSASASLPTSTPPMGGQFGIPRKPSPLHSRNVSNTSVPRSNLATPSPGESPARSPAIAPHKGVPEPETADLDSLSSTSPDPASPMATREADIASAMRTGPDSTAMGLGAAEKESQAAFLASHKNPEATLQDTAPRSRSASPSKSRVQALAGKFGEVSNSRRGSMQSNASRNSIQSWERSRDNSQPPSPTKGIQTGDRPAAAREMSFRPKLPGQWESYATNVPTPPEPAEPSSQTEEGHGREPLQEADITPTTAKRPVSGGALAEDPLSALKAAGAAMGQALQASVGLGEGQDDDSSRRSEPEKRRSHGDVYLNRPVQLDRTESSISAASSIPPTPPEKDVPTQGSMPPLPPLKEKSLQQNSGPESIGSHVRPSMVPQLSTEAADDDQESDRLRKEIVASLSPLRTSETAGNDNARQSLVPTTSGTNRESSILPTEYDSYWADGGDHSARPSHEVSRGAPEPVGPSNDKSSSEAPASEPPQAPVAPSLLTRFSWEDSNPNVQSLSNASPARDAGAEGMSADAEKRHSHAPIANPSHTADASQDAVAAAQDTAAPTPVAQLVESPTLAQEERSLSPAPGLHIVNSSENPEAVDLPPRLTAEASHPIDEAGSAETPAVEEKDTVIPSGTTASISAPVALGAASPETPNVSSPTSGKPLGFKEIMNIKSPSERIATYNKTRSYWATADHGLSEWIKSAISAKPELASQAPLQQPQPTQTPTSRHRATGSISLFRKHSLGANNSAQAPATPTASGSAAETRPYGPGSGGSGARTASQQMNQMQAKGKDFLHTAGKMSGKGMTQAKGLFAKGKSRFRASGSADKDSPFESPARSNTLATEAPALQRKKRMSLDFTPMLRSLSSSFQRTSRSRSRPNSVAITQDVHQEIGIAITSQDTSQEAIAPFALQRPLTWNVVESTGISPFDTLAVPKSNSTSADRLGVLPSPARSTFSMLPAENDGDIPPVPAIPEHLKRSKQDLDDDENRRSAVLESIIRYATPPALDLATSPVVSDSVVLGKTDVAPWTGLAMLRGSEKPQDADDRPPDTGGRPALVQDTIPGAESDRRGFVQADPFYEGDRHWGVNVGELGDGSRRPGGYGNAAHVSSNYLPPSLERDPGADRDSARDDNDGVARGAQGAGVGANSPDAKREAHGEYESRQLCTSHAARARDVEGSMSTTMRDVPAADPDFTPGVQRHSSFAREIERAFAFSPAEGLAGAATATPRVSTAPRVTSSPVSPSTYQVVRAVEAAPYVASHSSSESCDDSAAALSQPDGSQVRGRRDELDDAPPVPRFPLPPQNTKHARHSPHRQQDRKSSLASSSRVTDGPIRPMMSSQDPMRVSPAPSIAGQIPASHKRSQSLLSAISSAVSAESGPISSSSSQITISRPSSRTRHPQAPSAKGLGPASILEEPSAGSASQSASRDGDYDLYADSNGIVKDVHDELGQPLRVPASPAPDVSPLQHAVPMSTTAQHAAGLREDARRNSEERPMSFVSGPRDSDGRPQDEINTPTPAQVDVHSTPVPRMAADAGQHQQSPYQSGPRARDQDDIPKIRHAPSPVVGYQPLGRHGRSPQNRYSRSADRRSVSNDTFVSQPPQNHTSPAPQSSFQPNQNSRSLSDDAQLQNGTLPDSRSPKPGVHAPPLGHAPSQSLISHQARLQHQQPQSQGQAPDAQHLTLQQLRQPEPELRSQSMQESLQRDQMRGQNDRAQNPQPAIEPKPRDFINQNGPASDVRAGAYAQDQLRAQDIQSQGQRAPARNHYELQQRLMQQQVMDPRFREANVGAAADALVPELKQEGTSSTRGKFVNVFKGRSNKASNGPPQIPPESSSRTGSQPSISPVSSHAANQQSMLPNMATRGGLRQMPSAAPAARPQSMSNESYISQISQSSTSAQAPASRLDLRYPIAPASGPRPPSQLQANNELEPPLKPADVQPADPPSGTKKKRFSALGAIFGRSLTAGHNVPPKPKLSKDEKKAQKALQKSTDVPQNTQSQQWPQHQQSFPHHNQQQQQQPFPLSPDLHGSSNPTASSFPGAQGTPPQISSHASSFNPRVPQGSSFQAPGHHPPAGPFPRNAHFASQQLPQGSSSHPAQSLAQQNSITLQQQLRLHQQLPPPPAIPDRQLPTRSSQAVMQAHPTQTSPLYEHPSRMPQQQGHAIRATSDSSAFLDTRRAVQDMQVRQNNGQMSNAPNDLVQSNVQPLMHRHALQQSYESTGQHPPLAGYYRSNNVAAPTSQDFPRSIVGRKQVHGLASAPQPQQDVWSSPMTTDGARSPSSESQQQSLTPLEEPQYETPQIPAAYSHVQGAYVSPGVDSPVYRAPSQHQQSVAYDNHIGRQMSEPQMHTISPQVSAQSQMPPYQRTDSDVSTVSAISPVGGAPQGVAYSQGALTQQNQRPRMSSIQETTQSGRPWNLDIPPGATEQDIVRARHQQFVAQQLAAQQQQNAERLAQAPTPQQNRHMQSMSPGLYSHAQQQQQMHSPIPTATEHQLQMPHSANHADAFTEVLPRAFPQYHMSQTNEHAMSQHNQSIYKEIQTENGPAQPSPIHPGQLQALQPYPLPRSRDHDNAQGAFNPHTARLPSPPVPSMPQPPLQRASPSPHSQSPVHAQTHYSDALLSKELGPPPPLNEEEDDDEKQILSASYRPSPESRGSDLSAHQGGLDHTGLAGQNISGHDGHSPAYSSDPPTQHSAYEDQPPDEPPPSYTGPGIQNEDILKGRPRPPNLVTDHDFESGERQARSRQASVGLLQHPQPASMAASPSPSSADMGADTLRRQMLEQEERDRQERVQRAEMDRQRAERERQERERARARARELERSVSGGGRVGSLRNTQGSTRSGYPLQRGASTARPVFELSAVEDDEPVMRATSFPGQEWVPTWTED